ncbi:hypothetical protein [Saccharicrinis fermentans]|uniref:hypothetical protein n=1 Tax=Saccharicrinis fermentans TaxID=982 RepID=UPI00047FE48E|nr:hypothetical protein [Saccharicrinis fermentans]
MALFIMLTTFSFLSAQEKPEVEIGGALRYNYNVSSWKPEQQKRGGDLGFDVFRINAKAKYKGLKLNAEYRFYSEGFGGAMLKQGWIGYDFSTENNLQLGLTQVPFGITQYNSHSWFFSMNYYVGLEDDHDMGLKYTHIDDQWEYAIAFFKNAEELSFGNNSDVSNSRYAYDVGSSGSGTHKNKEINQFNVKVDRKFSNGSAQHKVGVSAQYGGVYNIDTKDVGDRYAWAAHYELKVGSFDLKAQVSKYSYNTENPDGEDNRVIAMTAYGAPYMVASEALSYTLGAAYTIPVEWGPVSSLQFYNDFGMLDKTVDSFEDSFMNVTGVLVSAGNVYTYIDFAQGKDQPWLGAAWTNGLGSGTPDAEWENRFNINIGYYF